MVTYTRATLAEFQDIFTGFDAVTDAQYDYWATQAELVVTDAYGSNQAHATLLATAHYLTVQGLGSGSESMRHSKFGGATNVKSGTLSLSWEGAGQSASSWASTSYGKQLEPYIRLYHGGPFVTGTGCVPVVSYGTA